MTETQAKNDKPFTYTASIRKTEFVKGRRAWRSIDEGVARVESDGSINVYLHSLPIGGFDGHIHLRKIGTPPPIMSMSSPQRPDAAGDADEPDSED